MLIVTKPTPDSLRQAWASPPKVLSPGIPRCTPEVTANAGSTVPLANPEISINLGVRPEGGLIPANRTSNYHIPILPSPPRSSPGEKCSSFLVQILIKNCPIIGVIVGQSLFGSENSRFKGFPN